MRRGMPHAHASTPFVPRSSSTTSTTVQAVFARWLAQREWDSHRWELVGGRSVHRPPVGAACASVVRRLQRRLADAAERTGVVVLEPRQALELPTGDTLVPDVCVLSAARWASAVPSEGDLLRVVPELVVEVLRERDASARAETQEIYARAGVDEHWIVDPRRRTVTVLVRRGARLELGDRLAEGERLRPALLPHLQLAPHELFRGPPGAASLDGAGIDR